MAYFTQAYIDFFKQLGANNHRDWFQDNKKTYDKEVKQPFQVFVKDLIAEIAKVDTSLNLEVKDAIFRINRDIRFSKDKTPYKTHMAAVISPGGRRDHSTPGMYLMMGAENMMSGGGVYGPSKEDIYAIRQMIARDPKAYNQVVGDKKFVKTFGEMQGEENKIVPKEFKAAAEIAPHILKKQWYYMAELPAETCLRDDLLPFVMELRAAAEPVKTYLANALKA
ncbi:MAG: DUF2461 domain-containing protein [Flavobacteriales bacterium]|nr:DUF2461 domain-containing protein [Flavobacteriales bacterium]